MKLVLLEALSQQAMLLISELQLPDDKRKKILDKNNDIKSIGLLTAYLIDNKLTNKLLELAKLSDTDTTVKQYQEEILTACINVLYPEISKSITNTKAIVTSAIDNGFDVINDSIRIDPKWLDDLMNSVEKLRTSSEQVKSWLFSYLITNRGGNKLTDKDVIYILNNFKSQFNESDVRDLRYKLDSYIWLKKVRNLNDYGIPTMFNWDTSRIQLGSKSIDVEDGFLIGTLSAHDIRRWLNLFERKADTDTLLYYLNAHHIEDIDGLIAEYTPVFKKLDGGANYEALIKFLKRLHKEDKLTSTLQSIQVPEDATQEDVYKVLVNKMNNNSSGFSNNRRQKSDTKTIKGLSAMKIVLKSQNLELSQPNIENYIERIARNNRLISNFKRWSRNFEKIRQDLSKDLTYDTRLKDGVKSALDSRIIELLRFN